MQKMMAVGLALVSTFATTAALADEPAPAAPPAASASTGGSGGGFSIGARVGYALAMGEAVKGRTMSDSGVKGAIPFQLDALYRINSGLGVGAYFSYAMVSLDKDKVGDGVSGSWMKYGLQLQYRISPDASMDPWVGYGIGMETLTQSGGGFSINTNGLEFAHLMAGLDFKAGNALNVGPFVDFSLGQYSSISGDISGDITDKGMHQWLFIGVRGMYDM